MVIPGNSAPRTDRTTPSSSGAPPELRGHLPALDGLRGLAILMVMVHHFGGGIDHGRAGLDLWFSRIVGTGWCGVDLFFVLSGFLITGILYDTKDAPRGVRNASARRMLRIFPLYYGVLLVLFVVLPIVSRGPTPGIDKVAQNQGWLWLYCSNIAAFFSTGEPFRGGLVQAGHFWSLAIEEQFYLVWPLVVLTLGRQTLMKLCAAAIVAGLALRMELVAKGVDHLYLFTPCRLDGLMTGALLALALRSGRGIATLLRYAKPIACISGAALMIILIARGFDTEDWVMTTAGFTLLAIFFAAAMILLLAASPQSAVARIFRGRTLTFFGKYSYGLYVLHFVLKPIFQHYFSVSLLTDRVFHHYWPARFAFMALSIAASLAVAWLSWHLYEKQFLKLKRFFQPAAVAPVRLSAPQTPLAQAA
jgi:peptidoglycan/LPS O-acetylase OafA/YrhL